MRRDETSFILTGLWILFLLYLAFVIYGSLVPFHFRPLTWSEAMERFSQIHWRQLGIGSRADWVANLLLFIPLAFLAQGLMVFPGAEELRRLLSLVGLWAGFSFLAVAIEFTQVYFAPRTVSLNDIAAESTGALIGSLLWLWRGHHLASWLYQTVRTHGPQSLAQRLFYGYVVLYTFFQLLPLDLTISPVEVYHQWRSGNVVLVPFQRTPTFLWQGLYNLLTDIALLVPVGWLAVRGGWIRGTVGRRVWKAMRWGLMISLAVELLQLFVYSRVTDTTDVLMAAVGAGIGAILSGSGLAEQASITSAPRRLDWHWVWLGAYCFFLFALFWFPFDFHFSREEIVQKVSHLRAVPFYSYYYSTEFQAVTSFLRQFLFFMPLGLLLYWCLNQWSRVARNVFSLLFLLTVVGAVEFGQLFLSSRMADNTDILIGLAGGTAGFVLARWLKGIIVRGARPAV